MTIIYYLLIGMTIGLYLLTFYLTMGLLVNKIFDQQFSYYSNKSRECMRNGDYDRAAHYNDKMGTAARRADFVSKITFLDL